ncbi:MULTISPECIES: hypothetical protein [unclassified Sphingobacterium]|uniref:hypothetical protein n=1 Tax=unclassified Sphingobacterium TaxID=2609468 RepID=UPI00104CCD2E|nr:MULTISPECIES: hypothetical protein [unclassified Sphingobacterium]MCS3552332.1 thioredoxin-related protein [Sphingobacterium sp. JUb21]TCR10902.1 hypothetical protein EDF66_101717 [Sphingobacterium sp. JUb20]
MKRIYHLVSFIILINFFHPNFVNAQVNCEQLLKKKISLQDIEPNKIQDIFKDFVQLSECGIDSTALEIISTPPLFATLILPLVESGNKKTTYQDIFNVVLEFQNSSEFPLLKASHHSSESLKNKKVDLNTWISDQNLLLQIPIDSNEVQRFHSYLKDNLSRDNTYFEAWSLFKIFENEKLEKTTGTARENTKINNKRKNEILSDKYYYMALPKILKEAERINRNVVIYFTGWGHVDSRKLEVSLFNDMQLNELLFDKFMFVTLYTDDKTKIENSPNQNEDKATNMTIGKRSKKIQLHYLGSEQLPAFILLNSKGELIRSLHKNINKATLLTFLTEE